MSWVVAVGVGSGLVHPIRDASASLMARSEAKVKVLLNLIPGWTQSGFVYAKPQLLQVPRTIPALMRMTQISPKGIGKKNFFNSKSMLFKNRRVPDVT